MADKERDRKPQHQDDDVVGKAYDSRLMGRLLTYLRPYKLQGNYFAGGDPAEGRIGCARPPI